MVIMIAFDKKANKNDNDDSDKEGLLKKKNGKRHKKRKGGSEVRNEEEEGSKCQFSCMPIKYGIKAIYNFITKGIGGCFGVCYYPVKERIAKQCDEADRDLNPYKDPNYNPYDYL